MLWESKAPIVDRLTTTLYERCSHKEKFTKSLRISQ